MAARKTNANKEKEQAPAQEQVAQDQAAAAEPDVIIAEVVEKFRDKHTGSILKAGVMIAAAPERFAELEEAGVVKRAED